MSFGWTAYSPLSGETYDPESRLLAHGPLIDHESRAGARPELADVRRLAKRAVRTFVSTARHDERPTFGSIVRSHLGLDMDDAAIVTERWPAYDAVNVQAGIDGWLAEDGRTHELVGVTGFRHHEFGLADMLAWTETHEPQPGRVSRKNLPSGPDGQTLSSVVCGLYLVRDSAGPAVILQRLAERHMEGGAFLDVMAPSLERAREIAATLRSYSLRHNVFRGHFLTFDQDMFNYNDSALSFLPRPDVSRDAVILGEEVLAPVERQVMGISRHREALLAGRQHLKRGLLLYGPPGTGKTHLVRYLVGAMKDATIVEMSGAALHLVGAACSVARALQPSIVIVEDVDLIAEERGRHGGENPLLFQLLNEMDGLDGDADVVFLLTTNRADLLEPALAARPGRVDQAVELTTPDLETRRRLFDLYRGDLRLTLGDDDVDEVLRRCEGVTASFIKELLRRSALVSAEAGSAEVIRVHVDDALDELLSSRNRMTRASLGGVAEEGFYV